MFKLEAVESIYYHLLGIKKEFPKLNPIATGLMMAKVSLYGKEHHPIIEGYPLLKEGPFIATGNHFRESDIYKVGAVARRSHRLIRAVVKKGLVVKGFREAESYLRNLGEDALHENDYKALTAWVLKRIGVIAIPRDNPGINFIRQGQEVLKTQGLGIFLQPTRYADCILRNLEMGAAYFAKLNRNVPIYLMAFSGPPLGNDKITVFKPFTYANKEREYGRELSHAELTIIFADMLVTGLPENSQLDWATRWPKELKRLSSPKK